MKKIFFALVACAAFFRSVGQSTSGIYLNGIDYSHGKLASMADSGEKFHIRLNEFLASPRITVVSGSGRQTYAKDSIFGYRNSDGTAFRFFNRDAYEVLNGTSLPQLYKRAVMHGGKGAYTEVTYYFSKDASSLVLPLTLQNIRLAYAADSSFVERVFDSFGSDDDLIQYDSLHAIYKLNRIYGNLQTANR